MKRTSRKIVVILVLVSLLSGISSPRLVRASGPYDAFSENPLQYWVSSGSSVNTHNTTSQTVKVASYDGWLEGFTKRKTVTLGAAPGSGTNYQVCLNVTYDSDMQTDFDDLRFTDNDRVTLLSYWLEQKIDSSYALVWVKVTDSLESGNTIYMYYGNSTVSGLSDGDSTFPFFDDFNDGSLNLTKWTIYSDYGSEYSETGGSLVLQPSSDRIMIGSDTAFGPGYAMVANASFQDFRALGFCESVGDTTLLMDDSALFEDFGATERQRTANEATATLHSNGVSENSWQQNKVYWYSNAHVEFYVDSTELDDHTTNIPDGTPNLRVTFYVYHLDSNPDLQIDWIFVRKLASSEPSASYGSETVGNFAIVDIGIPIVLQDHQSIFLQLSNSHLGSSDSIMHFNFTSVQNSGFGIDFNSTGFGTTSRWANHVGIARFAFEIDNTKRYFSVHGTAENGSILFNLESVQYLTANDWLNISCSSMSGYVTLYALSGDLDYRLERTYPEANPWVKTTTYDDEDISNTIYNFEVVDPDDDVDSYDVAWKKYFTYFQYFRVVQDWQFLYDAGTGDIYVDYVFQTEFKLYYENGSTAASVTFEIEWSENTIDPGTGVTSCITIVTNGESSSILINQDDTSLTNNGEGNAHIAVSRDTLGHLVVMWSSDCYVYTLDGSNEPFSSIEDHIIWTSDDVFTSWKNSSIEISYSGAQSTTGTGTVYTWFNYQEMEFNEFSNTGIAGIHFSNTWDQMFSWGQNIFNFFKMLLPGLQDLRNPFVVVDQNGTWPSGNAFNFTAFIEQFSGSWIAQAFSAFSTALLPVNNLLNVILDTLPSDIADAIRNGLGGFNFDLVGFTLNAVVFAFGAPFVALYNILATALGLIGQVVGFIVSIFGFLASILTIIFKPVTFVIGLIAAHQDLVGLALVGSPFLAYMLGGKDGMAWVLNGYKWAFFGILDLAWRIFFGVVNTIGNFLPLT